jgi:metal-responsive CopG/Arc/MetJ family transcriptional regulator
MRTLVDIPDTQIEELIRISRAEKVSRAEIIRQAVAAFIEMKKPDTVEAFGLWKEHEIDGLAYQEQLRAEW